MARGLFSCCPTILVSMTMFLTACWPHFSKTWIEAGALLHAFGQALARSLRRPFAQAGLAADRSPGRAALA
jgi:hypothetical protein